MASRRPIQESGGRTLFAFWSPVRGLPRGPNGIETF